MKKFDCFEVISYLLVTNILAPIVAQYVFFVYFGKIRNDARLHYSIESYLLVPKGALLASIVGLLFTFVGTIALSVIGLIVIQVAINYRCKLLLLVYGSAAGTVLGYLVQKTYLKSMFVMEVGALGFAAGLLIAFACLEIFKFHFK